MSRHTPVAKRGKGEKMGQEVEQPDIPQVVAAPLLPCGGVLLRGGGGGLFYKLPRFGLATFQAAEVI